MTVLFARGAVFAWLALFLLAHVKAVCFLSAKEVESVDMCSKLVGFMNDFTRKEVKDDQKEVERGDCERLVKGEDDTWVEWVRQRTTSLAHICSLSLCSVSAWERKWMSLARSWAFSKSSGERLTQFAGVSIACGLVRRKNVEISVLSTSLSVAIEVVASFSRVLEKKACIS